MLDFVIVTTTAVRVWQAYVSCSPAAALLAEAFVARSYIFKRLTLL